MADYVAEELRDAVFGEGEEGRGDVAGVGAFVGAAVEDYGGEWDCGEDFWGWRSECGYGCGCEVLLETDEELRCGVCAAVGEGVKEDFRLGFVSGRGVCCIVFVPGVTN